MAQDSVFLDIDGAVARIVLNRPSKKNALTWDMWKQISAIADQVDGDDTIKVVIVSGVDETAFAAGADIVEFESVYSTPETSMAYTKSMQDAQNKLARLSKPLIAQIQGPCMGAGCAIAMCADVRFADPTAKFSVPPARLGLVYSLADTKRLVDAIGASHAKDMIYTARVVKAEEAASMGLVNRICDPAVIAEQVASYASSICQNSRLTTRATNQVINLILAGAEDDTDETRALFIEAFGGEDFQEGRAAFLEKRRPKFTY